MDEKQIRADFITKVNAAGHNVFALRNSPTAPLKFVIAAGETVEPGDFITFDRATGKVRKFVSGVDTGQAFVVPPGSRVTGDGYLEMPHTGGQIAPDPRNSETARYCTAIADQVVPQYRDPDARHTGCTSHTAKRWQAAWDGACIALGGDPKEYLG